MARADHKPKEAITRIIDEVYGEGGLNGITRILIDDNNANPKYFGKNALQQIRWMEFSLEYLMDTGNGDAKKLMRGIDKHFGKKRLYAILSKIEETYNSLILKAASRRTDFYSNINREDIVEEELRKRISSTDLMEDSYPC